jgi:hypothetical protein
MNFFKENSNTKDYFMQDIEIKQSPVHGLGVFATADIPTHTCFEICPVIHFSGEIFSCHYHFHNEEHILTDYMFKWEGGEIALVLGYGSLYNHAAYPNAFWRLRADKKKPALELFAKKDIKAGEEIFIKYQPDSSRLEFIDEKESKRLEELGIET